MAKGSSSHAKLAMLQRIKRGTMLIRQRLDMANEMLTNEKKAMGATRSLRYPVMKVLAQVSCSKDVRNSLFVT